MVTQFPADLVMAQVPSRISHIQYVVKTRTPGGTGLLKQCCTTRRIHECFLPDIIPRIRRRWSPSCPAILHFTKQTCANTSSKQASSPDCCNPSRDAIQSYSFLYICGASPPETAKFLQVSKPWKASDRPRDGAAAGEGRDALTPGATRGWRGCPGATWRALAAAAACRLQGRKPCVGQHRTSQLHRMSTARASSSYQEMPRAGSAWFSNQHMLSRDTDTCSRAFCCVAPAWACAAASPPGADAPLFSFPSSLSDALACPLACSGGGCRVAALETTSSAAATSPAATSAMRCCSSADTCGALLAE